jgi:hypothetical protein
VIGSSNPAPPPAEDLTAYAHDAFVSDAYRFQLQLKHARTRWGTSGQDHAPEILAFARQLGAETALDYGCGVGTLKPRLRPHRLIVQEYDPGIRVRDRLPGPADLVVCTDVLEHVEPERVGAVWAHLRRLTRKGAYVVVSCRPAQHRLPDGRNAHLTVMEPWFWRQGATDAGFTILKADINKGYRMWLVPSEEKDNAPSYQTPARQGP